MGLTQSQDVSATSTLTGPVVPQLAINIVVRHMVNSLLYIAGLFRCFYPAFGCCDRCRCVIFGALLVGFRFSFAGAANMAQAKAPAMAEITSAASPIIVSIPTLTSHQN